MARHLRLTIDVAYDLNGEDIERLVDQLYAAAEHLADNGLLSGEGDADVDTWTSDVEETTVREYKA